MEFKNQQAPPVFEIGQTVLQNLTSTQQALLRILLAEREAKTMDMAARLGLSRQAIQKALAALKAKDLVRQIGRTRDAVYTLAEKEDVQ